MQREGNTLSQILRDAWDGYRIQSQSLSHTLVGLNPTVSLVAYTTATELKKTLKEVNTFNGFSNRFLWTCTRRSKYLPFAGPVPDTVYNELVGRLRDVNEWVNQQGRIVMTLQDNMDTVAKRTWEIMYPKLSQGGDDIISSITARSEVQAARLMLLYAVLDKSTVITTEHLKAAIAIIERSIQSVKFIYGDSTGDPIRDAIIEGLKQYGPMTQTGIHRKIFQSNMEANKIKEALQKLSAKGMVICKTEATKGKTRKIWMLK